LRPVKKGEVRNPKGIRGPMIKPAIENKLSKERAAAIAETIIAGAEKGDDSKIKTLLNITGELTDSAPQIAIQQNNSAEIDMVALAKEILRQQNLQ
jgi:hypothetical protein